MPRAKQHHLNFALLRAPLFDVIAVTGGVMRADGDGALVDANPASPTSRAMTAKGRLAVRRFSLVAPLGDAVLVEFSYLHNMGLALSMMLPDVEVLSFRSNWETTTRGCDQFQVFLAGYCTRSVEVEQGWTSTKLKFTEMGPVHPAELNVEQQPTELRARLGTEALLAMAENVAPGAKSAIETRDFTEVTSFEDFGWLAVAPDTTRKRTTRFEEQYAQARALGIGADETPIEEHESQQDHFATVDAVAAFGKRFYTALDRARPDAAKVAKAYDKWIEHPDRPDAFKPVPSALLSDLDLAGDPAALAYLRSEAANWRVACELAGRIRQTIWAQDAYAQRALSDTDVVEARAVCAFKSRDYPDVETAVREAMAAVLGDSGIVFAADDPVMSEAEAKKTMVGHLHGSIKDFAAEVNSDATSDISVAPVWIREPKV